MITLVKTFHMGLIEKFIKLFKREETTPTDYDKIKVTSSGTFYMESEDIFDNREESLKLIKKLRESVDKHKSNNDNSKKSKTHRLENA